MLYEISLVMFVKQNCRQFTIKLLTCDRFTVLGHHSLLAKVSHHEAKMRERRETEAGAKVSLLSLIVASWWETFASREGPSLI